MASEASSSGRPSCAACSLVCGVVKLLCFSCCQKCCCCIKPPPEPKPEFSVLCLGLSGAGKSTLLSLLAGEPMDDVQPTMGFAIKAVLTNRSILNIKELGGSDRIRPYWSKYYSGHEAVIFVVDSCSSDSEINEVRSSLEKCLSDPELKGLPLLLLCNKQDLPSAQSVDQLKERLLLSHLMDEREHTVVGCSCKNEAELKGSLDTMVDMLLGKETQSFR